MPQDEFKIKHAKRWESRDEEGFPEKRDVMCKGLAVRETTGRALSAISPASTCPGVHRKAMAASAREVDMEAGSCQDYSSNQHFGAPLCWPQHGV